MSSALFSSLSSASSAEDNAAFNATIAVSGLKLDAAVLEHQANLANGETLANQRCIACHGEAMLKMMPIYPSLKGQKAAYLFKQLIDFKRGERTSPLMQAQAGMLSETEMKDVALYFSQQPQLKLK